MVDDLKEQYKTGTAEGERHFFDIVEQIKKDGQGKKYDCVVGVQWRHGFIIHDNQSCRVGIKAAGRSL